MNNIQKIFIMTSVGSIVVLFISVFALGYNPIGKWVDSSNVDISTEKYEKETKVKVTDWKFDIYEFRGWADRQKRKHGEYKTDLDLARLFRKFEHQNNNLSTNVNWIGIIAFANIFVSLTGFFLFKKK